MTPFEWAMLIGMILGAAYSYANQPKAQRPAALTLDDVKAPVAQIGKEIPVLFGTRDIADPNVVWYGDLRTVPVKTKSGK